MTKQSIVFFDIDGTLLDHDKELPKSAKQAVSDLKAQGHIAAIATGRAPFMFEPLRKELGIDTYVSYNGQYAVSQDEVIFTNPINKTSIEELTKMAVENDHPLVYMNESMMKSNIEYHPHVDQSLKSLKFSHPEYDPDFFKDRHLYQSLLFCTAGEEKPYEEAFDDLTFIRWHEFSMDIIPRGGSKANGIQKMIQHLGIPLENVYAFGDGLNDIEMLKAVPNSIAMGNGLSEVKEAAKLVTKPVDEDGILHGLKKVELIK
ncbi:Cof-type HAD-IIB family hydrolase [Salinibacillus aidingensis]|uniref:Cof-type HAD-IIB family hydrolase n=1 Tax=Salinibacillus aidingensis TaxID=237684 RepID=A0ABP3LHN1_9BACI